MVGSVAPVHILSKEISLDLPVFDLQTEAGDYIAAGIVVHNCDETTIEILDAAMGQTMALGGVPAQTVLSSTHHYANGTMTEIKKRAKDKGWPIYTWCFRETVEPHGWLAVAEVKRKEQEVTTAMWLAEYELQEPSADGRAIDSAAVEAMFSGPEVTTVEGQELELEPPVIATVGADGVTRIPGGQYATGADWAKSKDWTVIVTYRTDVKPMRVVAFLRIRRRPWPDMVAKFDARVKRYPGPAAHDATGIGDVIAGYMKSDAEGVTLVGRERSELFAGHIHSIEHHEVTSPRLDFMYAEHKYVTTDDLYGDGHPPDSFVAAALAKRATRGSGWLDYARSVTAAATSDVQQKTRGREDA